MEELDDLVSQARDLFRSLDKKGVQPGDGDSLSAPAASIAVEGDANDAAALLRDLIARFPAEARPYRLLCKLCLALERWRDAADVASVAQDAKLRIAMALDLIRADCLSEALEVIESTSVPDSDESTWFQLEVAAAKALDALGREEEAIAHYNRAALLNPDDASVLHRLAIYDREQGHWPQCRPQLLRLQRIRAALLPPTLDEGLRVLWRDARQMPSLKPALEWAWRHADQRSWNKEDWLAAALWGVRAHALMREWWRWAPERANEMLDLLEPPDLTPIRDALKHGRGCILACAHVGERATGVEFLQQSGLPFTSVSFAGSERVQEVERERRIILTANRLANARAVCERLKAGDAIAWSVDSPFGQTVTFEFLGRRIKLLAAPPRYAARYASASFWCLSMWRGDRVVFEIERLPDPVEGESDADWTRRWYSAFLKRLEKVIRGDPRNLVCEAGLWADFSSMHRFGVAQALLAHASARRDRGALAAISTRSSAPDRAS